MKQIITLDFETVRDECIKHNWYTIGTTEDYLALATFVDGASYITDRHYVQMLQEIAEDIKQHSDTEYEAVDIMTVLANACKRHFVED